MADGTRPAVKNRDWCAYCGEKFGSPSEGITVVFEGEEVAIHRQERGVFMERGLLKYRDGPRTGPLSEFSREMIIISIGVAILVIWFILPHFLGI